MEDRPPKPESEATRGAAALAAWALGWAAAGAVLAVGLFASSGHDDSYITFGSAYALRHTGSITNYNGERLEQSSALASTVLLALGDAVLPFLGLPAVGFLLSMAAAALCTALATRLAERLSPGSGWAAAPLAATSTPLVYWAASGMETTLAATSQVAFALAAGGFIASPSAARGALLALAAGLLATVRPEGPIVLGCVVAALIAWAAWRRRGSDEARAVGAVAGVSAAVVLALVAWRSNAFGLWLPHPAVVKASGGARWSAGLSYLGQHLAWTPILGVGALIGAEPQLQRARATPTAHGVIAAAFLVADIAFVVRSGGDWMEFGRFLAPGLGIAAALLAALVWDRAWPIRARAAIVAIIAASQIASTFYATTVPSNSGRTLADALDVRDQLERALGGTPVDLLDAGNAGHARDVLLLAKLDPLLDQIRARTNEPIVLFSGQAGMVPYYVFQRHENLVFIDACSLTTNRVNPLLNPKGLRATSLGVRFPLTALLAVEAKVKAETGLGRPDVIWDSGQKKPPASAGYVVVYDAANHKRRVGWFGNHTIAGGYIAVREDWARTLGLQAVPQTQIPVD